MQIIYVLIAIAAGMTSAFQSGTNQTLSKSLDAPMWSLVVVATVTLLTAVAATAVSGERLPAGSAIAGVPWYAWLGGILGIGFVLGTVFATPKLGAGLFMALIVTAELLTGLLLDHFGLLGVDVHRANIGRLAGGGLMVAGVILIAAY